MSASKNKHLSLDDKIIIEKGLTNGSSRSSIADTLGKDKSTICKEVKKHRTPFFNSYGHKKGGVYDCIYIKECGLKFCSSPCDKYQMQRCSRRDRTVGVCNGCPSIATCKLSKYKYSAELSHKEYLETLSDSRQGINMTSSQAKELGDLIKPLIQQNQSIYTIVHNHPEICVCEKTLYNYIENNVFEQSGIKNIDLRLKSNRKISKKSVSYKPRESRAYLKGRTYKDFEDYVSKHPSYNIIEMDTVYNDTGGPFIQTFQFVKFHFMIAVLHEKKTSSSMVDGLKQLKELLGEELFSKLVKIILTDRGSEFIDAEGLEETGCKVFYCDPMCSWQKPHVENNHRLLRYILPKEKDLKELGLRSQKDLDLIFSHINSYPREELGGRSPIEVIEFFFPKYEKLLSSLNIQKIDQDHVCLNPDLIKK